MLTARELTDGRRDVAETLVNTCVIQRASGTTDSYGLTTPGWAAHGTVDCRIDPFRGRDPKGRIAERESTHSYLQATFAWDCDIAEGDRVIFGSDTLELVELQGIHDDRIVKRAILAKIEGA